MEPYEGDDRDVAYYEGPDRPPQRIDLSTMASEHQWPTQPEQSPSFQHYVMMNPAPRADMVRIRTITQSRQQDGTDIWSILAHSSTLFRIPDTLQCERTFARDCEEAYYLDAMDLWLRGLPEDLSITDIPLVKGPFAGRLAYAFSRRQGYFNELYDRRRLKLWTPFDHLENKHYSDVIKYERYPWVEEWMERIEQPSGLPVPVPFVVFYFPTELFEAMKRRLQGLSLSERQRRLLFCLEKEYYVLFASMWWSEASFAGRQFVLTKQTVDTLMEQCSELSLEGIKPVPVILDYMRIASNLSSAYHVWVAFRGNWMEESTFVWATKVSGAHNPTQTPVRTTFFFDKKMKKLTISEHSSKLYKRNTALDKKVGDPDLDKIPGLLRLVREQNWNLRGDIRVGDLLGHLFNLYMFTRNALDTMLRQGFGAGSNGCYGHREHYCDDRGVRGEAYPRRVTYDGYRDEREDRRPDANYDDRIRSARPYPEPRRNEYYDDGRYHREDRYAPPELPHTETNRGGYRDLDGEAALFSARNAEENAESHPPRRPPSCKNWLLGTPRVQPQVSQGKNVVRTPALPFSSAGANASGGNQGPDQAELNARTLPTTTPEPEALTDGDYTKQGTGNVPWLVPQCSGKKRRSEDVADQRCDEGDRNVRPKTNEGPSEDSEVVRQRKERNPKMLELYARHPPTTARFIATAINEKGQRSIEQGGGEEADNDQAGGVRGGTDQSGGEEPAGEDGNN